MMNQVLVELRRRKDARSAEEMAKIKQEEEAATKDLLVLIYEKKSIFFDIGINKFIVKFLL